MDKQGNKKFEDLKVKWEKYLCLRIRSQNEEFTLETDASNIGIGAVLLQNN